MRDFPIIDSGFSNPRPDPAFDLTADRRSPGRPHRRPSGMNCRPTSHPSHPVPPHSACCIECLNPSYQLSCPGAGEPRGSMGRGEGVLEEAQQAGGVLELRFRSTRCRTTGATVQNPATAIGRPSRTPPCAWPTECQRRLEAIERRRDSAAVIASPLSVRKAGNRCAGPACPNCLEM